MSRNNEDVFLSYAREDTDIASRIAEYLESSGITVYRDINIRSGTDWRKALEAKLKVVKCIFVLWSRHSVESTFVLDEADYGRSRQTLVAARLDDCDLPFGFRTFQTDDLSGWQRDTPPAGIKGINDRLRELIAEVQAPLDRTSRDEELRKQWRLSETSHVSVSNRERDRDAVRAALGDQPAEVHTFIENGYAELAAAQYDALNNVNERLPPKHYALAAEHFRAALNTIAFAKARTVSDGRSVDFILSMERAYCLTFAAPEANTGKLPIDQAIEIYTQLARDKRYSDDISVHFRLGCALVRKSKTQEDITRAIRSLRKARKLATETMNRGGLTDPEHWLPAELAKQLGLCNYLMSEVPGIPENKRKRYIGDAIQESRAAIAFSPPPHDHDQLFAFTVLKARGNLLYFLAQQMREGFGSEETKQEIRDHIGELKRPDTWSIVENQVHIIDDIAFAASTIGDWQTTLEEASRNIENFASLAVTHGLEPEERAMDARAKEICFFAKLLMQKG